MITDSLVQHLENQMGEHLRPFVRLAMKAAHRFDPEINFLNRDTFFKIQASAIDMSETPKDEFPLKYSPDNFITSKEEIKRLKPELEKLRFEVFGKTGPPYKDLDQAIKQIKIEAKKQTEEHSKNHPENKYSYFQYSMLPITREDVFIIYPEIPLARLANETKLLSESTSFSQESLLRFILTGAKPTARIFALSKGFAPILSLKIYKQLPDDQLAYLFKKVKEHIKLPRKRFTDKHVRLGNFFEEHGQPPAKNKQEFWENAFQEWKRLYPNDEIGKHSGDDAWRSLMMAKRRLDELLKRR